MRTESEKHERRSEVRTSILCLKGLLLEWKNRGKIDDQQSVLALVYLKKLEDNLPEEYCIDAETTDKKT